MQEHSFYSHSGVDFLKHEYVEQLKRDNRIVDGSRGGLVKGPFHSEGGIFCYRDSIDYNGEHEVVAEIEGWEFIVNTVGTEKYKKKIEVINNEIDGTLPFEPYNLHKNVRTIDAEMIDLAGEKVYKLIKLSPYVQWIVNRHSTQKYLNWLIGINNETLPAYLKAISSRR